MRGMCIRLLNLQRNEDLCLVVIDESELSSGSQERVSV